MLVLRNWNTTDLSAYFPNGEITFSAKCESGAGELKIGMQDCNRDRSGKNDTNTFYRSVSDYAKLTSE